jgi:universal stress protein E
MSLLHRILVATDFSPAGHAAVARAGQLASQYQAQITVVHATPDWRLFSHRATAHQEHYAGITRTAAELLNAEVSWLAREYHVAARAEIHQDSATLAITRVIESFHPDMVVVGAGGEHPVPGDGAFLGGTALKLIARVPTPLLLVREPKPAPYRATLAAIDGDMRIGERLTRWASLLAGAGICHVVRAYDAPYLHRLRLSRLSDAQITECAQEQWRLANQECETLRQALPDTQLAIHLVRGPPVPTILEQVVVLAPQLVVLGQHMHHPDEHPGAWAAGLGTRLAYHCPTDVLMIP